MPRTKATVIPITERDARGYGYVGGKMRRNGGVTAIAAINGRGAYARNLKAREVTGGKSPGLARRAARSFVKQALREPLVMRVSPAKRVLDYTQRKYKAKVLKSLGNRSKPMLSTNPRRHKAPTAKQLAARAAFARKAKAGLFRRNAGRHVMSMPAISRPIGKGRTMRMNSLRRNPMPIFSTTGRRTGTLPRYAMTGERGDSVIATHRQMRLAPVKPPRRSLRSLKLRSLSDAKTLKMPKKSRASRRKTRKASSPMLGTLRARWLEEKKMKAKKRTKRTLKARAAAKVSTAKRRIRRKKATKRQTVKQRAASLRNLKKARKVRKVRKTRRVATRRSAAPRKRVRRKVRRASTRRQTAKQRSASLRNLKKARAARKVRKVRKTRRVATRRSAAPRKRVRRTSTRRQTAKQRSASLRNLKKARASRGGRKYTRKSSKRMRRNGRMLGLRHGTMRRNDTMGAFSTALKVGTIGVVGFVAHKFGTALVNGLLVDKLVAKGVQAAAETPALAPAASGLGAAQPLIGGIVGGGVVLALGVLAVNKFVESQDTKRLITAGMVTSYLQTILVTALERVAPQAAPMLAGGEASRMSAMYGIDPTSIGPRYAPINGMGEYFAQNGLGEYFAQNGLGEYFAQNGLGNYTGNPDIQQAAAGYGELNAPSNYIDPSSDLERELTIAEAAAGVGDIYQAAAGMGDIYQAAAGFGNIGTVPRSDTTIPSGQLWAGTRSIGNTGNAENPGGVLSTAGGEGIFG